MNGSTYQEDEYHNLLLNRPAKRAPPNPKIQHSLVHCQRKYWVKIWGSIPL